MKSTSVLRSSSRSTLQAFITLGGIRFVNQGKKQVFQRRKLMTAIIGQGERGVNGLLQCIRE